MAKIPQTKKERALKWIQDVNNDFDSLLSRIRPKFYDWWRLYRTFENQETLPGNSNVFIPKIYEIIEKKVPAIIEHEPRFIISPRKNSANSYIGVLRDTLGFWWDEDKMQQKLEKWVKDAFIFGVGLVKADWYQEIKPVESQEFDVDEETGASMPVTVTTDEVVFEHPTAELVSVFDIKVDPRVETFQQGVGVLYFLNDVRYASLMEMDKMYDLSEIESLDVESLSDEGYATPEARDMDQDNGINPQAGEIDKNKMTLVEFWGKFSPTGKAKDEKEYIITAVVVDNQPKYVIRCDVSSLGFRPFVKIDDRVVRGEFFSIGEVEPLEGLQIEYNNLRNARIDFNNAVNYPEWMYNINAGINPANLVHRPNNLIPVDLPLGQDVNSVLRPIAKDIPPVSGINEEAQMNNDFQTISQTIDFTDRGGSQGFTNTATGVKSRDIQVGRQGGNVIRHLESAIGELGQMWLALAEQFAEDTIQIRRKRPQEETSENMPPLSVVPDKFTELSKDILTDALYSYSVKVEAGSTTADTAEGKARNAVNISNTAAQMAALGVPVNMVKVWMDVLTDSFQKSNPEEYIMQQQPMMPGAEGTNGMPSNPAKPGGKVPLQPSQATNLNM